MNGYIYLNDEYSGSSTMDGYSLEEFIHTKRMIELQNHAKRPKWYEMEENSQLVPESYMFFLFPVYKRDF